jgi:hypothetical protein
MWGRGVPGACRHGNNGGRELLVRVGEASVAAGVAGLTVIGLWAWMMHGSGSADAAARAAAPGLSVFGTVHRPLLSDGSPVRQADPPQSSRVRLASLQSDSPATTGAISSFDDRFAPDRASFEDRFGVPSSGSFPVRSVAVAQPITATVAAAAVPGAAPAARGPRLAAVIPVPRAAPRSVGDGAPKPSQMRYRVASLSDTAAPSAYAPADTAKDGADKDANPLAGDLSHTAIYDISAHTVYLPSGERLEAHSGLGGYMDDVRSVHLRKIGPTPPNVYELSLRERPFHGVQAIRLNPVDAGKMYGRDGILVHPFMLGPDGQSNGCVSLRDYPAFLNAYRRGEITRLVVVEQLDDPPSARTAADWFSNTLKRIFGRS